MISMIKYPAQKSFSLFDTLDDKHPFYILAREIRWSLFDGLKELCYRELDANLIDFSPLLRFILSRNLKVSFFTRI